MSFARDMKEKLAAADISAVLNRFAGNVAGGIGWLARGPRGPGTQMVCVGAVRLPLLAAIAVGCVLIFATVRSPLASAIWAFDSAAIRAARRLPGWIVVIFNELTDFGKSGWFLWPLGIALLATAAVAAIFPLTRMSRLVLAMLAVRMEFLFAAIAVPGIFANILKRFVGRGRPFVGGDADVYLPFDWRAAYASMPSGHATTGFSVLVAFGVLFPQWRPYLWAYALVIAISRVVVTAHHPSDVLAGALIGALGAVMVRNAFAVRRRAFTLDAIGLIHPMAGPSWQRIKTVARGITGP